MTSLITLSPRFNKRYVFLGCLSKQEDRWKGPFLFVFLPRGGCGFSLDSEVCAHSGNFSTLNVRQLAVLQTKSMAVT